MLVKQLISAGAADFAGYVRSAWSSNRQRRSKRRPPIGLSTAVAGQADSHALVVSLSGTPAQQVSSRWEDYSDLPEEAQQASSVMLPASYLSTARDHTVHPSA